MAQAAGMLGLHVCIHMTPRVVDAPPLLKGVVHRLQAPLTQDPFYIAALYGASNMVSLAP